MIGQLAPDGSPVEVFATFPVGAGPDHIDRRLPRSASVLDLGCGAGRLALALAARGHRVTGVDISPAMIARFVGQIGAESAPIWPTEPEGVVADVDGLDLGRRFDAVVLSSYLVNDPDRGRAHRFLAACRRHVHGGGRVFVQRHQPAFLADTDALDSEEGGFGFRYERLETTGDGTIRATMTYAHGDRSWTQEFETVIVDDDALRIAMEGAGLVFSRWLDEFETWAEAVPA